jgi:hypothetical protein
MRTTYRIEAKGGRVELIGSSSLEQAMKAAEALFPGETVEISEPSAEELRWLFRTHTFDGINEEEA